MKRRKPADGLTVGLNIRRIRSEKSMTQQQCGVEAGISQQHLAVIEAGSDLKVSTLISIARALDVEPETLLGNAALVIKPDTLSGEAALVGVVANITCL